MYRLRILEAVEAAHISLAGAFYAVIAIDGRAHVIPREVFELLFDPVDANPVPVLEPEDAPAPSIQGPHPEKIYGNPKKPQMDAKDAEAVVLDKHRKPKQQPRSETAIILTQPDAYPGYPKALQDPRSELKRLLWDRLKQKPADLRELLDALFEGNDDKMNSVSQALYAMRAKDLIRQLAGAGSRWEVVE